MPLPSSASTLSDSFGGPYTNQHDTDDPTTEMDCDYGNQELADVASMSNVPLQAWVRFAGHTWSGSGTDSIPVVDHGALWGSGDTVKPTIGQTDANTFVITWPATVTDALGSIHTLNVRYPNEPTTVDTVLSRAKATAWTANTVTVKTFNAAGLANGLSTIPVFASWR